MMRQTILYAMIVTTVFALGGLIAVGAEESAPSANVVEMRLSKVMALEDMEGTIEFVWGNESASVPFAVQSGEPLIASHQFTGVPLEAAQVFLVTNTAGDIVLHTESTFEDGVLRLKEQFVDESRIGLDPQDASLRVVVGSVTGDFKARVVFRSVAAAQSSVVTLAVDTGGDGVLDPHEHVQIKGEGKTLNATMGVEGVPSMSPWSISVVHNSTTLVAYRGTYDWLDGSFASAVRDEVDPSVSDVLERIEFAPVRLSVSGVHDIPNNLILRSVQADQAPGELPKLGLVLTFGEEAKSQDTDAAVDEEPGTSASGVGFAGLQWTLPFILATAAIILVIGLLFRRGRRHRDREVEID